MFNEVKLKELKEELKREIKKELEEENRFRILGREELQELFNCNKTKMNEIMNSIHRPPVVYIGRDYYITERQIQDYFNQNTKKYFEKEERHFKSSFKILHKRDLMGIFKMGRTKFLQFINTGTLPVKVIGQEYYVTEGCLEEWFDRVKGTTIELN